MASMDRAVAIRAGITQAVAVAVLSVALGLALSHGFFDDWGWLVGPGAWILCALVTARVIGLPVAATLIGAALAGVPSLLAVLIGAHWLGAAVAIVLFALWCGRLARDRGLSARAA
jgi:hypothetical protein